MNCSFWEFNLFIYFLIFPSTFKNVVLLKWSLLVAIYQETVIESSLPNFIKMISEGEFGSSQSFNTFWMEKIDLLL